jgi:hypothetical protein
MVGSNENGMLQTEITTLRTQLEQANYYMSQQQNRVVNEEPRVRNTRPQTARQIDEFGSVPKASAAALAQNKSKVGDLMAWEEPAE